MESQKLARQRLKRRIFVQNSKGRPMAVLSHLCTILRSASHLPMVKQREVRGNFYLPKSATAPNTIDTGSYNPDLYCMD
jgi:hypothetical protein